MQLQATAMLALNFRKKVNELKLKVAKSKTIVSRPRERA